MRPPIQCTIALLAWLALAGGAATAGDPVALPRSETRDIRSETTGETYRIFLWQPATPPPPAGYPVVYLLDANAMFRTMAEAVDLRSRRPEASGVVPAVLVGIGYPTDEPLDVAARIRDLTPAVPRDRLPVRPNGAPWPATGGADALLDFIERQVKPMVAATAAVDRTRETIVGHSFGGLFVLHALFTRPDDFDAYVAGSPSIWFGDRFVRDEAKTFLARPPGSRPLRLLITVGGDEQTPTAAEARAPNAAVRREWKARNRMVDNARELAQDLQRSGRGDLEVAFALFPDEDHVSVMPALVGRALTFALAPGPR